MNDCNAISYLPCAKANLRHFKSIVECKLGYRYISHCNEEEYFCKKSDRLFNEKVPKHQGISM